MQQSKAGSQRDGQTLVTEQLVNSLGFKSRLLRNMYSYTMTNIPKDKRMMTLKTTGKLFHKISKMKSQKH